MNISFYLLNERSNKNVQIPSLYLNVPYTNTVYFNKFVIVVVVYIYNIYIQVKDLIQKFILCSEICSFSFSLSPM